jgi:HAD superfamily hydrolase (TIGR01549 family)
MTLERAPLSMTSATPPSAVLFDVGDTLLVEERFDLEAGLAAVVHDRDVIPALAIAFRADALACHRTQQELLLASWLQQRVRALKTVHPDELEDRIWRAVVTLSPIPGDADVLQRLAHDGVRLAAISNAAFSGRILLDELSRHDMGRFLQFVLSSADLGARKPATTIFNVALERLAACPEHAWFIGDTFDEDVAGALNAGLAVFWLTSTGEASHQAAGYRVLRSWSSFLAVYDRMGEDRRARPAPTS